MGDRCTVTLTCRPEHAEALSAKSSVGTSETPEGLTEVTFDEVNYAGGFNYDESGDWPSNIPYTGTSYPGGDYPGYLLACDGKEFAAIEALDDNPVVTYSLDAAKPYPSSLQRYERFLRIRTQALAALQKEAP